MKIEILGESCNRCDTLAANVVQAIKKMGRMDLIIRVRDPDEITARGIWKTPALAVDGRVEIIDAVPDPESLVDLFIRISGRTPSYN